ncbi:MAG: NnrS family protein, partial [Gammaproteobacteria bacterium]
VAYVLITLAAILRVSGPLFPGIYLYSITIAGVLWIGAFTLFLIVYAPILVMPRADGKPG